MSLQWGGRFAGGLDPLFADFNRSLPVDQAMAYADLMGSVAWAEALAGASVLSPEECERLTEALGQLSVRFEEEGVPADTEDEDIHGLVERLLTEELGPLAKKLHTGRSRNDQVATDLKVTLKARCFALLSGLTELMVALVERAADWADLAMPGYTHLQRAQPITAGHWALAYVEMFERDRSRILDAAERMDTCPLGSGALAGTTFPIDREALADVLQFGTGATRNSLDAVSDRDHVLEFAFCCATVLTHLSRLAEDTIFFASQEAGLLTFSDGVATGSSLMPQKKNPDAMELVRGKCGRVVGALTGLFTLMKALPLAYDKDLQEDKEAVFDALDTTQSCLAVTTIAVAGMTFDRDRCRAAASSGFLNATDLADLLVAQGMPFRDAHEAVGKAVLRAQDLEVELEHLPTADRDELLGSLTGDLEELLGVDAVLARRDVIGGTAPERVREEIAAWEERFAEEAVEEEEP